MGLKKPVISVIMPCYNAEKYLGDAVRSFIDNTISRDCELIIVNDGSTDRSGEIIKDLINTYKEEHRDPRGPWGIHGFYGCR